MSRETTLSQALIGTSSFARQVMMVLAGSAFIAVAAQISVPMFPVPMTLQTLAILMVGFAYGSRLGAATLVAYLAEGAMGLPVFANGMNGAAFFGPTAGFLLGFVAMAWAAGWAAERGIAKGVTGTALAGLVISALLYVPGLAWPMAVAGAFGVEASWIGNEFTSYYWAYFMAPFLVGDAVKAGIAALLVAGGWKALSRG
jgi:biotin transport system substrate-specific component